jgi:hypothetical protein
MLLPKLNVHINYKMINQKKVKHKQDMLACIHTATTQYLFLYHVAQL